MPFWLSTAAGGHEARFIQVGDTLLNNARFKNLSPAAKALYFCCAMEAKGNRNFQMTESRAVKYGITPSSLRRHLKELKDSGFIQITRSGKNTRTANDYQFCMDWRNE